MCDIFFRQAPNLQTSCDRVGRYPESVHLLRAEGYGSGGRVEVWDSELVLESKIQSISQSLGQSEWGWSKEEKKKSWVHI